MATIDWNAAEEAYGSFKQMAPLGEYEVVTEKVEISQTKTGSIAVRFKFKNNPTYSFPRSTTHWISMKNRNWSAWHQLCLLQVLGVRKEDARAAIDKVEASDDPNTIIKGYTALFTKAIAKGNKVTIIVREQRDFDGNLVVDDNGKAYTESEFKDPRVFSAQATSAGTKAVAEAIAKTTPETASETPADGGQDSNLNLDDIPF